MTREVDDGVLSIDSQRDDDCDWKAAPGECAARDLSLLGGSANGAMLVRGGLYIGVIATRARQLQKIDAFEIITDVVTDEGVPLTRHYRLWFPNQAGGHSLLQFAAPVAAFPAGAKDVAAAVDRISFK